MSVSVSAQPGAGGLDGIGGAVAGLAAAPVVNQIVDAFVPNANGNALNGGQAGGYQQAAFGQGLGAGAQAGPPGPGADQVGLGQQQQLGYGQQQQYGGAGEYAQPAANNAGTQTNPNQNQQSGFGGLFDALSEAIRNASRNGIPAPGNAAPVGTPAAASGTATQTATTQPISAAVPAAQPAAVTATGA